jgi:Protein of unknown function (DUF2909)
MLIKILLVAMLLMVIISLFRALFVMLKGDEQPTKKMSTFLGKRLIFSVAIVILLLILVATGVITPNQPPH